MSAFHPATLLATWFWSGWLPKAPGTWGSLAALPFAYGLIWVFDASPLLLLGAAGVLFLPGCWASALYATRSGREDPGDVVVDEVVGQWMVLAVAPLTPLGWLLGFILFRLFDVLKPWPIRWFDGHVKGGFGIMLDDVIAGVFACAIMLGLVWLKVI